VHNTDRSPAGVPGAASTHAPDRGALATRFFSVRAATERLAEPLGPEDMVVQSMTDASPAKWHMAHTTWFFEQFVLSSFEADFSWFDEDFAFLFNSYYRLVGPMHARARRGVLTRPPVERVVAYRQNVEQRMGDLLDSMSEQDLRAAAAIIEIGLQHEQQHQELFLTDLKHLLSCNPLRPAYRRSLEMPPATPSPLGWIEHPEGVRPIGFEGEGFSFDCEGPRHRVFLEPFAIADRLVTSAEYQAFMEDRGYERTELWLEEGWTLVNQERWASPLYWRREGDQWIEFTLAGERPVDPHRPVTHLSFFEADAYARWAEARLPTEQEWEVASEGLSTAGNFVETDVLHPAAPESPQPGRLRQAFGDCWEWTRSAFEPYPGYAPAPGAIGEYNGKFMSGQMTLRGGSCATPQDHIRRTYRNFFHPDKRWQFAGVRLARSLV